MRIAVISDIHDDLESAFNVIRENPCIDFVLHGGDQSEYPDYGVPFYSIYGNHEDFSMIQDMMQGYPAENNWNLIHNDKLVIPSESASISIVGLGGNYSEKFSNLPRSELRRGRERHFTLDDVTAAKSAGPTDIFISHEPSPMIHYLGKPIIEEVLRALKPKYAFSGHHHWYCEKKVDGVTYISLPRPSFGYVLLDKVGDSITHKFYHSKGGR